MSPKLRWNEEGQIFPALLILFAALVAGGVVLFQVGHMASLRADATSAADAAALEGAKNMRAQLLEQASRLGYSDITLIDESQACAAAQGYAAKNGGRVTSCDVDGLEVTVEVESLGSLDGDADRVDAGGETATSRARAELHPSFTIPGNFPNLGITSASKGLIHGSDWKEFKEEISGQPLDIVALGRFLQSFGYQVGEHPAFGGVCTNGCHVANSWHYRNGAIDVNADHFAGGEMPAFDRIAGDLSALGYHVLWRVEGHFDHMHIDIGAPGCDCAGGGLGPASFEITLVSLDG